MVFNAISTLTMRQSARGQHSGDESSRPEDALGAPGDRRNHSGGSVGILPTLGRFWSRLLRRACAGTRRLLFGTAVGLIVAGLVATLIANERFPEPSTEMRLRLQWGGGPATKWHGLLEVSQGTFSQPMSLGVGADDPGSVWIDENAVWIERRSARVYDGIDVTLEAPATARLNLTLKSPGRAAAQSRVSLRLDELQSGSKVLPLGGENERIVVGRAPGDALDIEIDRSHLIYEPGEHFVATVAAHSSGAPRVRWELAKARSGEVIETSTRRVEVNRQTDLKQPRIPIDIPLPSEEGVYDLRMWAWSGGEVHEQGIVQVVVLAEARDAAVMLAGRSRNESLVDQFRPGQSSFLRRIDGDSRVKLLDYSWRRWLEMFPQAEEPNQPVSTSSEVQWSAYRLQIENPGSPHRLEVLIPQEQTQHVGVSILEPNAAGQLMPVGLDTGVRVARADTGATGSTRQPGPQSTIRHEVLFWPRSESPILLLHDLAQGHEIQIADVAVYELSPVAKDADVAAPVAEPTRLVGPLMQKPLLPETFGATEVLDAASGRSLDDYATFYTAAERLADYLHYAGYNSLMIAALADGSAIYPSRLLQSTPRYDSGLHFSTGQDRMQKDVLELLLRVFDRERLALVPQLRFSTPLPALERQLAIGGPEARSILLIGADGRSWRDARGTNHGLAPYYNPLHPAVQQAVVDVVTEVAQRYAGHPSFHALAVELTSAGYLQFPSLDWGYDDETVARFARESNVDVPNAEGNERFRRRYEFLTGPARAKWMQWRCQQVADFHKRLARAVTAADPDVRFLLAGTHLVDPATDTTSPEMPSGKHRRRGNSFREQGLDFDLYRDTARMVVLRPTVWTLGTRPADRLLDENAHSPTATKPGSEHSGRLFFHTSHEVRIREFDEMSPWQPAYTWLVPPVTPAGRENENRYAQALAADDAAYIFDGGWTIPFGQEHYMRRHRRTIQALPAVRFHTVPGQPQPIVVRTARHNNRVFVYAVNAQRGPVSATMELDCGADTRGLQLPDGEPLDIQRMDDGRSVIRLSLDSHEIWACELSAAEARVENVSVQLTGEALDALQESIQRLDSRLTAARSGNRDGPSLPNPGFEMAPGQTQSIPGWNLSAPSSSECSIDNANSHTGYSSLKTSVGDGHAATLRSPVQFHEAGRVAMMRAWLRSDRDDVRVRLLLEFRVGEESNRQFADVTVDNEWREYVFRVKDVPSTDVSDAQVGIEIHGPAVVWADDIDVGFEELTDEEMRQLIKLYSAAKLAWQEERYFDCRRLVDSYWGRYLLDQSTDGVTTEPPRRWAADFLDRVLRR